MGQVDQSRPKKTGLGHSILSLLVFCAIVLAASWVMRSFIISPYQIPSGSMETTIMTGDNVFSEKVTYYTRAVAPGDIVTFDDPEIPSRTLIKRCIAVAGQTVDLKDGVVVVDGVGLDESYTNGQVSLPLKTAGNVSINYPYTIPEGDIWVMGDNRTNSADSRYFGPVSASTVSGRACLIYWPLNHISTL